MTFAPYAEIRSHYFHYTIDLLCEKDTYTRKHERTRSWNEPAWTFIFTYHEDFLSFFFGWKLLQCRWVFAYSRSSHYTLMLCESWRKRTWVSEWGIKAKRTILLGNKWRRVVVGSALMLINSQVFLWVIQKDPFKMLLSEKAVKGERERVSERK